MLQFPSMPKRNSAKILSILMGLIGGLVAIFLLLASLFPDLDLPTLSDLLNRQTGEVIVQEETQEADESTEVVKSEGAKLISLTATEANTQAWDLLTANHQIIFQEYDFGIFIEGINGLKGDQNNFWAIYLNGEKSLSGIGDIVLNEGDLIEFRYEAIE